MTVVALVMAGGRGTRMKVAEEKPLLRVLGEPMIGRVVSTLRGAKVVRIIVAVTKDTPKTAAIAEKLGVDVIQTPGLGYVEDMIYAIKSLRLGRTLVIPADIPLLKSEVIDKAIAHFEQCSKPALALVAPLEKYEKLGLKPDHVFDLNGRQVTWVGVNIVEGVRIDEPELDQENLLIEEVECVVNVNTAKDLITGEQTLLRRIRGP